MEDLEKKGGLTRFLHIFECESFKELKNKIGSIEKYKEKKLLEAFNRIYKNMSIVRNINGTLPNLQNRKNIKLPSSIKVPKLNPKLDYIELTIKLPPTLTTSSYFALLNITLNEVIEEVLTTRGVSHSLKRIPTLLRDSFTLTYSIKTLAGRGGEIRNLLLSTLGEMQFDEQKVEKWKTEMASKSLVVWKEGKLNRMLAVELLYWRRILKAEDYLSISAKEVIRTHKKVFFGRSAEYIIELVDF